MREVERWERARRARKALPPWRGEGGGGREEEEEEGGGGREEEREGEWREAWRESWADTMLLRDSVLSCFRRARLAAFLLRVGEGGVARDGEGDSEGGGDGEDIGGWRLWRALRGGGDG